MNTVKKNTKPLRPEIRPQVLVIVSRTAEQYNGKLDHKNQATSIGRLKSSHTIVCVTVS